MTNQRKHGSQMTAAERQAIRSFINSVPRWTGFDNPHVIERKAEKKLSDADILCALKYGEVIEAHANNFPDIRFVVRVKTKVHSISVCASIHGSVVTAWANGNADNHHTLDKSQYQWRTDLTRVFCTLKG